MDFKATEAAPGIYEIETHYLNRDRFACCYLLVGGSEAAVIETNTNNAVPYILETIAKAGLERNQVKYVIVTHIHLDHAGGSGKLMRHLPEASLLLHPRGKRHIIDPTKLIESAGQVYGEEKFKTYYGDILPVDKERVKTLADGEIIKVGARELTAMDAPGHARHHLILFDKETRSVFSGDAFGIGYPRYKPEEAGLVFPSTSPTQFDPDITRQTMQKIVALQPNRILRTHTGAIENIDENFRQLSEWLAFAVEISNRRYDEGLRDKELADALEKDIWARFEKTLKERLGIKMSEEDRDFLFIDASINALGLAHYITNSHSQT
jgi:glyoxylase-like metal-dependent hydrolase (beta-lactamase superfamily II)